MNMLENLLCSKNCKENGYYIKQVVSEDIDDSNYKDFASPLRFGYINSTNKQEFITARVRTKATTFSIHTYGERDFSLDDIIRINDKFYYIEDFSVQIETRGNNKAFHYFINLK